MRQVQAAAGAAPAPPQPSPPAETRPLPAAAAAAGPCPAASAPPRPPPPHPVGEASGASAGRCVGGRREGRRAGEQDGRVSRARGRRVGGGGVSRETVWSARSGRWAATRRPPLRHEGKRRGWEWRRMRARAGAASRQAGNNTSSPLFFFAGGVASVTRVAWAGRHVVGNDWGHERPQWPPPQASSSSSHGDSRSPDVSVSNTNRGKLNLMTSQ